MVRLRAPFGFPMECEYRFQLRGRLFRVGPSGLRTLKLLTELYESYSAYPDGSWLVRFRNQIRHVQALNARSVLSLVVERTDDPTLRLLAIWLRGRSGGSLGTTSLAKYCSHPNDQIRKEVARSLRRMGAWVQLRAMADGETNPRIRRIATVQSSRPYDLRLTNFSRHFSRLEIAPVKRELICAPDLDLRQGRPPKSRWVIRMILERIHRMVAGHSR